MATKDKTVKAKKVKEGDFLLGLDNGYVVENEEEGDEYKWRNITFHTAEGEEAHLHCPDNMPILIRRHSSREEEPTPEPELPPYRATHVSVRDGSPAMMLGYDEDDTLVMLVNEDGYRWSDPTGQWREIGEAEPVDRDDAEPIAALTECHDLWASGAWSDANAQYDLAEVMRHVERLIKPPVEEEVSTYKVPTLTKGELIALLAPFPDDTLLLGYTDKTDYVNIDGIGNTDFEGGPALVIETRDDYDPRQF